MNTVIQHLVRAITAPFARLFPEQWKHLNELAYWRARKRAEGTLGNDHYVHFYTAHFDLTPEHYAGKRVLDVGCGPRGSLEWATMAARRVGIDPLADQYLRLGADRHAMTYVAAPAEAMPFPDADFDVVCSFNSIDHVSNLGKVLSEIARVTRPGGLFLLLTDVGHAPTACEPQSLQWSIVDELGADWELCEQRHYEKQDDGLYQSILRNVAYDHKDARERYGILSAKMRRRAPAPTQLDK